MTKTMRTALDALRAHLHTSHADEVAEIILDVAQGANPLDDDTRRLLKAVFDALPEPDNFTEVDLAREITEADSELGARISRLIIQDEVEAEEDLAYETRGCPGWNDSCGNLMATPEADLCGDCHAARLDYQSPRIGEPRR